MAENENNAARKLGEKRASQIRDTAQKVTATAEQTVRTIENTRASTAKGLQEFNFKAIEFARANSDAAFECAKQSMTAKSLSEMLELWATHTPVSRSAR